MSTLQDTLTHRRTGARPSDGISYSSEGSLPAVSIYAADGELWVLPWSHFVSARHTADGECEKVTILFASHQVEMRGARLALLMPEIAGFRLGSLRGLPAKYEALSNASEPFVERLSVRPIGVPATLETAPSS
jgi:hypothetical protein